MLPGVSPDAGETDGLLAPLTLLLGDEELLVSRAVARVRAAALAADPQADVRELAADAVDDAVLWDLASPSLFGGMRVVVVRDAQELAEGSRDGLIRYAADPTDGVLLVVAHSGVQKGKRLVDALQAAGARVQRCPRVTRPAERLEFVQAEIRAAGRGVTVGACRALVDAVGSDLRELAGAAAQLVADLPGAGAIDEAAVARFHRGRAETTGFQVADAALGGDAPAALALLRHSADTGTADLLVVSALASGLRELARVRGAGGGDAAGIARQLGLPPWKVDKALRVARGWSDGALSLAVQAVAVADEMVKGASAAPGYAVERAVLAVAGARQLGPRR
jgi:DNA polymerase-3 subunit delta